MTAALDPSLHNTTTPFKNTHTNFSITILLDAGVLIFFKLACFKQQKKYIKKVHRDFNFHNFAYLVAAISEKIT